MDILSNSKMGRAPEKRVFITKGSGQYRKSSKIRIQHQVRRPLQAKRNLVKRKRLVRITGNRKSAQLKANKKRREKDHVNKASQAWP